MISSNQYFDGNVQSLGFENSNGKSTVGVMAPGEYEFNTGAPEKMTLISGQWALLLPGSTEFVGFGVGEEADIPGDSTFKVKIIEPSAYHCAFVPN